MANTVEQFVNDFTAQITEQVGTLTDRIKVLDQQHRTARGEVAAQLKMLKGLAKAAGRKSPGSGQKMSPEARAKISAALKARSTRLATEGTVTPVESASLPSEGAEAAFAAPKTTAKAAAKKAVAA